MADFILTPRFSPDSLQPLTELRRSYFPPERNYLAAHVTLFHKLPGEMRTRWESEILNVAVSSAPFQVHFGEPYSLGRGFALKVESSHLIALRQTLAEAFWDFLSPQDRQKYKPHCTIQNKVEPARAKSDLEEFKSRWQPQRLDVDGLELWEYRGGPWSLDREFSFA